MWVEVSIKVVRQLQFIFQSFTLPAASCADAIGGKIRCLPRLSASKKPDGDISSHAVRHAQLPPSRWSSRTDVDPVASLRDQDGTSLAFYAAPAS